MIWRGAIGAALLAVMLASCGIVPVTARGGENPLSYDQDAVAQADRIAVFIPGALSSVDIFDATKGWEDAGFARVMYRYPGLDDLPLDHRVRPETAAAIIVDFANRYPAKDITLVGYSTGGPIALLAAPEITKGRDVRVAAMSTGVDYAGGFPTILRGVYDVGRAIAATGSLDRQTVWKRFWAGLLYGPAALDDPDFEARLASDIPRGEEVIVELNPAIALSHGLALPGWELPADLDLTGIPVAFFVGLNDRVFSTNQTLDFARKVGGVTVYGYRDQGHLLFFTRPDAFEDIRAFAEGRAVFR